MKLKNIIFLHLLMVCFLPSVDAQSLQEYLKAGDKKLELKDYDGAIINYDLAAAIYIITTDSAKKAGLPPSSLKEYLNFTQVFYNRGLAKSYLKEYKSAIDDYTTTIKLKPSHANAIFNRAQAEFNIKDYQAALDDFNKYIGMNPRNASSYFSRGVVKIRMGDVEGGCADLKKASTDGYAVPADFNSRYCK